MALSQSGRTPDVVEYVERAAGSRRASRWRSRTSAESPLAEAGDAVLPLAAGPSYAIAATKTYTTQVAALALLAGYAAEAGDRVADGIREVTQLIAELLPDLERRVSEVAVALAFVGRMFVIGRGPEFATAREISLKLLETCRVAAEPLTATDLAHGPVAALDGLFPVWAIASDDPLLAGGSRGGAARAQRPARRCSPAEPGGRDRGCRLLRAGSEAGVPAARAAALGRARPGAGLGAGAGEGSGPGPPGRPDQGHARALSLVSTTRCS